jgi:hypothetical protein
MTLLRARNNVSMFNCVCTCLVSAPLLVSLLCNMDASHPAITLQCIVHHACSQATVQHACSQATVQHACSQATVQHACSQATVQHACSQATVQHACSQATSMCCSVYVLQHIHVLDCKVMLPDKILMETVPSNTCVYVDARNLNDESRFKRSHKSSVVFEWLFAGTLGSILICTYL